MSEYHGVTIGKAANKTNEIEFFMDDVDDVKLALEDFTNIDSNPQTSATKVFITGTEPLGSEYLVRLMRILLYIRRCYPNKEVWLNTTYKWEDVRKGKEKSMSATRKVALLLANVFYERESRRCIDIKKSLLKKELILWKEGE